MKQITFIVLVFTLSFCGINKSDGKSNEKIEKESSISDIEINSHQFSKIEIDTCVSENIWDTIDKKANWFKNNSNIVSDISEIPKEIVDFYSSFISDSLVQISKIDFKNLIGVIAECETTIRLGELNWEYIEFDYEKFIDDEKLKFSFYFSKNTFYYEVYLVEIGMMYQFGFELKSNVWKLTLYTLGIC